MGIDLQYSAIDDQAQQELCTAIRLDPSFGSKTRLRASSLQSCADSAAWDIGSRTREIAGGRRDPSVSVWVVAGHATAIRAVTCCRDESSMLPVKFTIARKHWQENPRVAGSAIADLWRRASTQFREKQFAASAARVPLCNSTKPKLWSCILQLRLGAERIAAKKCRKYRIPSCAGTRSGAAAPQKGGLACPKSSRRKNFLKRQN